MSIFTISPIVGPTQRIIRNVIDADEIEHLIIISYCILTHKAERQACALIVLGAYPDKLREMHRCERGQISSLSEQVIQHLREEEGEGLEFESKNPEIEII